MTNLLIVAPSSASSYQALADKHMAIEVPIWAAMLAQSVRNEFGVAIYDMSAEKPKSEDDIISKVEECSPDLILFSVNGINPNSSSFTMNGCVSAAKVMHENFPDIPIACVGPHANAMPHDVLSHDCFSIVFLNEGVYTLKNLLRNDCNPRGVKGLWYKDGGEVKINDPESIVPQDRLPIDLPGLAYDLLPDFTQYRTSSWHCNYIEEDRSPFASIYTSLGCVHKCGFCMINQINRTSNDLNKTSADFNVFRYWDPDFLITQFDYIADHGVKNVKIADEMFVLKPRHFLKLSELLIERDYGFNLWSYSRIDSIRPEYLDKLKRAGVNYLALGIESANQNIRREISKGKFEDVDIREVVKMIEDHGINVGANYIVGNGAETWDTMQETLNLALELNTASMNIYAATPLPGSPLYLEKKLAGEELPQNYSEFGFLSYDHLPSATPFLTSAEVLAFRDYAWQTYHTSPRFINSIRGKFGDVAVADLKKLTEIKLKRKILGD